LLRTPMELSDGQRYRFRLAYALDQIRPSPPPPSPAAAGEGGYISAFPQRGREVFVPPLSQREREILVSPLPQRGRGAGGEGSPFILADEFAAMLDRTLAKVLAFNIRKLATRTGVGFLLATTHEDLAEDLNPNLHVRCLGDAHIEVERRDVKKKALASRRSFGCRKAPEPTGRILLGGIIAATTLPSCGGCFCSCMAGDRAASGSLARRPRR